MEARKGTLLNDGYIYTCIDRLDKKDSGWNRSKGYYYLRESENILYNYPNDTLLNYSWNDSTEWNELPEGFTEIEVRSVYVFDKYRLTYFLYIMNPYEYISYSDSIGFNDLHALDWRDWAEISRRLIGCVIDNKVLGTIISGVDSGADIKPSEFKLTQNYPNPFNPSTTIKYTLPTNQVSYDVQVSVYNTLGQQVAVLKNENQRPGEYSLKWNAKKFPGGVYFCRIEAGQFNAVQKMLLVK